MPAMSAVTPVTVARPPAGLPVAAVAPVHSDPPPPVVARPPIGGRATTGGGGSAWTGATAATGSPAGGRATVTGVTALMAGIAPRAAARAAPTSSRMARMDTWSLGEVQLDVLLHRH